MAYKKSSPAKKKKQGYNARLDDSLGAKHGKKKQSMKDRRDESEGMEKSMGKRKFSGNKSSAQGPKGESYKVKSTKHPMEKGGPVPGSGKGKRKGSPAMKKEKDVLVSKPTRKARKEAGDSGWVSMKGSKKKMVTQKRADRMSKRGWQQSHKMGSPAKMSGRAYDMKEAYNTDLSDKARLHYLENERHDADSPAKMSRELSYGGPVIDQEPKALSHMGASKVLKHMKSRM